jgi:DNA repair protein RecO (recombination protein O)
MASFTTSAIVLRRIDYGDFDLILSMLTLARGKMSVIAKAAKRSKKRFGGILELFSDLDVVCSTGRNKGLPILLEASLRYPFFNIRADIKKTAYASYWAELTHLWVEEGQQQVELYTLLHFVLQELDKGAVPEALLSILFQMKFLSISGLCPNLNHCCTCKSAMEQLANKAIVLDHAKGGLVCEDCMPFQPQQHLLSKGTVKQLQWIERNELNKAVRIRFSPSALSEGLTFLETFVPYHLGKEPRSLKFLQQIRN